MPAVPVRVSPRTERAAAMVGRMPSRRKRSTGAVWPSVVLQRRRGSPVAVAVAVVVAVVPAATVVAMVPVVPVVAVAGAGSAWSARVAVCCMVALPSRGGGGGRGRARPRAEGTACQMSRVVWKRGRIFVSIRMLRAVVWVGGRWAGAALAGAHRLW